MKLFWKFLDLFLVPGDRLYFLGGLIGGIAKGALKLGGKLVKGIKARREKKVTKAAEKLAKKKARLLEAENLIAETGGAGAGVSGFGKLLNVIQGEKGQTPEEAAEDSGQVTLAQGPGGDKQALKWGLIALGAYLAAKAFKIIK